MLAIAGTNATGPRRVTWGAVCASRFVQSVCCHRQTQDKFRRNSRQWQLTSDALNHSAKLCTVMTKDRSGES